MFVAGIVPFYAEGFALRRLGSIEEKDTKAFCGIVNGDYRRDTGEKRPVRTKYTMALQMLGLKFDAQYEELLDKNMCSDVCPCLSIPNWQLNNLGQKVRRNDPEYVYTNLHEELLNSHNRTKNATRQEFTSFNFTSDP